MNALAHSMTPVSGSVHDMTRLRIERALRQRERYRYVQPSVQCVEDGWLVTSPCCSRNVDPAGGEISIAWLQRTADGGWAIYACDHQQGEWVLHAEHARLQPLLHALCTDTGRTFWP